MCGIWQGQTSTPEIREKWQGQTSTPGMRKILCRLFDSPDVLLPTQDGFLKKLFGPTVFPLRFGLCDFLRFGAPFLAKISKMPFWAAEIEGCTAKDPSAVVPGVSAAAIGFPSHQSLRETAEKQPRYRPRKTGDLRFWRNLGSKSQKSQSPNHKGENIGDNFFRKQCVGGKENVWAVEKWPQSFTHFGSGCFDPIQILRISGVVVRSYHNFAHFESVVSKFCAFWE